jgi:nucleoside-diphosphate-sugar epimerase
LCLQAARDRQLVLKSPSEQRNFITLTDVARALEFLALNPTRWPQDGLLHLGSSLHWNMLEVAERIQRCTEELMGYKPPIQIPSTPSLPKRTPMHFNVERLAALGFQWQNNWEDEVKNTLLLCRSLNPIHP